MAMFCECADRGCFSSLPINDEVYWAKKQLYPTAAIILNGHRNNTEVILENNVTWLVVKGDD